MASQVRDEGVPGENPATQVDFARLRGGQLTHGQNALAWPLRLQRHWLMQPDRLYDSAQIATSHRAAAAERCRIMQRPEDILTYTAPPIVEAVVQFVFADPLEDGKYRKLHHRLKREYANEAAAENVNATVDFQKRTVNFQGEPQIRFSSQDEADVLVLQKTSLTWSRLAPYEGWERFASRVHTEMEAAYAVTGIRRLTRIGVRYINRIDIPPTDDGLVMYEHYLNINLNLPDFFPYVNKYAWRIEREFVDSGLLAIVQSAVVDPEIPNTGAIILDIDVVLLHNLPTKMTGIFAKLDEMRLLKNRVFEISISDKARASFNK